MEELKERVANLIEKLDIDNKRQKIRKLEADATSPSFWQDHQSAAVKMKELYALQKEILDSEKLQELIREGKKEEAEKLLKETEIFLYLSGPYDSGDAILYLHSGQGGVEAMDWTQMLYRMYTRYFERKGFSFETIEENIGEEAGLKSVVVTVSGQYVYGFLKHEAGVHRLVRQSPFNADNLRQTSFALVEVLPELAEVDLPDIEIKNDDVDWQFFRSSSKGGQNVQKVSTAVRLIHKPTGIMVTAQTERFQEQNREIALNLLRAKLWLLQKTKEENTKKDLKGDYRPASWGTQIRSYVLHPYKMVKDLRTGVETASPEAVLNGDLDEFIEAELKTIKVKL